MVKTPVFNYQLLKLTIVYFSATEGEIPKHPWIAVA